MKKFKKLIPALAMLLVSATAMSSATFAWFSMNREVSATSMQVKAVAEDGILISNIDKSAWSNTAAAKVTSASALVPTSAAAVAAPAFVHASSTQADNAEANQDTANYEDLTLAWSEQGTSTGIGYINNDGAAGYQTTSTDKAYVLLNKFYIKSSGEALSSVDLKINDVVVTGANKAVENALRVLVVVGGNASIYAPVNNVDGGTTTLTYKWKNTTNVTAKAYNTYDQSSGVTTIPNTNADAVEVAVYIYFEGEDANCKSTNISGITTNDLSVVVNLGLDATHTTP